MWTITLFLNYQILLKDKLDTNEVFGFHLGIGIEIEIIDKSRIIRIRFGFGAKSTKLKEIEENSIFGFYSDSWIPIPVIQTIIFKFISISNSDTL